MPYENGGSSGVVPFMPVAPTGWGGGYGGGGFGFGGDASFILILLLFGLFGGWGNGNGNGGWGGSGLYPWMNQSNQIGEGFANAEVAACNRAMNQMQTDYSGQIASLQSFNTLQAQLAQCCCDNRLATCQTQNLITAEAAATRASATADNQKILDKLCQLELDAKNETIANLRTQVNMQALAASQNAQTAAIVADNAAQTQYIVNRIAPYPSPAYVVANPNGGCGCSSALV